MKVTSLATVLLVLPLVARGGIVFTFENPGVQSTTVPGVITETFDSGAPSGVIGTYTNATISPGDVFGGAGDTPYLDITSTNVVTLDLIAPQKYFGMWWSAGDANDALRIYDGAALLGSFTTGDLIPLLPPAYFGSPVPAYLGGNASEPYAYLNFTATGASTITRIEFTQVNSGLGGFETDNHSITDQPIDPPGNPVNPVPDSGGLLGLFLAAAGLTLGIHRRTVRKS